MSTPWSPGRGASDRWDLLGRNVDKRVAENEFEFRVNREVRQSGSTSKMLVEIPRMIEYLSGVATLEPGDIIFTGARRLLGPLRVGDVRFVRQPR